MTKTTQSHKDKPRRPINIHIHLSERRQVAIVWSIEDVQSVRADLDDEQSWSVLKRCSRVHDCEVGFNWDLIRLVAADMFPEPEQAADGVSA